MRVPDGDKPDDCDNVSRGVPVLVRSVVEVGIDVVGAIVVVALAGALVVVTIVVGTTVVGVLTPGSVVVGADVVFTSVVDGACALTVVGTAMSPRESWLPGESTWLVDSVALHPASTVNTIAASNERLSVAFRRRDRTLVPLSVMLRRVWVVGSLLMLTLVGCGESREGSPSEASFILSDDYELPVVERDNPTLPTRTTGADGVVVDVTDVSRIIVLNQAIAEIVVSLGMRDSIIGRDATTTIAALADIAKVSNGHDISAESVLSLRPTVVIGDTRTGPPEAIEQLRSAGVPVLIAPEVWTLSSLPSRVEMIANALGVATAGGRLVALSEQAIADALKNVEQYATVPRVAFLYVRGTASVYLLGGSGSGADELVAAAGAVDVGALNGLSSFTPLTAEAIVQADPDVLLVMTRGLDSVGGIDGLLELPGVSSTRAAAARAVIAVDDDLLLSFGPRTGALISRLAELLNTYSSDA